MEMNQMPIEMIEEILVTLPVKTLLRFKCVCKHWFDLIESWKFVDRHYSHDSNRDRLVFRRISYNSKDKKFEEQFEEANGDVLNLEYFIIIKRGYRVGPVNGVFCEVNLCGDTIVLLNPATREVKRLPSLPRPRPWTDLRFGFGLDPSTGDYKTVAFYGAEFACVYSVSSGCWRVIEGVDPSLLSSLRHLLVEASWVHLCGGFCNGVYYWVCRGILAFDTIAETFREIRLPAGVVDVEMDFYFGGVGVYGGSTALFLVRPFSFSDMWVLGNGGCWSKILSFQMATTMSPPCVTNIGRWIPVCVWKNEVVFRNGIYAPYYFIMVDVCTHRVRPLRRLLRPKGLSAPFCYKESLVSFIPNRILT